MSPQDKAQDKFFQDALGDLEIAPPSQVWDGIEAGLQQKKRRRFIAYWSAAAGVLIGLFALYPVFNTASNNEIAIEQARDQNVETEEQIAKSAVTNNSNNSSAEGVAESHSESNENDLELASMNSTSIAEVEESPEENSTVTLASSNEPIQDLNNEKLPVASFTSSSIEKKNQDHRWLTNMDKLPFEGFKLQQNSTSIEQKDLSTLKQSDYVRPIWGLKWLAMVSYAPLLTNTDFIHYADIPVQQTIVQNNLRNQEVVGNSLYYNYSQQFGAYAGYKLNEQIDLIAGRRICELDG